MRKGERKMTKEKTIDKRVYELHQKEISGSTAMGIKKELEKKGFEVVIIYEDNEYIIWKSKKSFFDRFFENEDIGEELSE